MSNILTISASPSLLSKTAAVRRRIDEQLTARGHCVHPLDVRDLPPGALLAADTTDPAVAAVVELFEQADGIVIATPVFKASYSGLLKTLLDLLPQQALAGKIVLPLATGGTVAHALVIDYALRPVLAAMGSTEVVHGHFLLDGFVSLSEGRAVFTPEATWALSQALERFTGALDGRKAATEPKPVHAGYPSVPVDLGSVLGGCA
jgi:FMN reductase